MQDLRLAFRSPGDYGDKRTKPTPNPDTLIKNLDIFLTKWIEISFNGYKLFCDATIHEIEKLKVHASKGCLSEIEVGGGTNRNEAFHRYVNTFFHKSRIGILLSYALMMTIIHQYNTKDHHIRKSILKPLLRQCNSTPNEVMGIVSQSARNNASDQTWWQETSEDDYLDLSSILNILQVSLSQLTIYKQLKARTQTASSLWKYTPFMQILPQPTDLQNICNDSEYCTQKTRLQNTLRSWNFVLLSVTPDGNCFFTSVALALASGNNQLKDVIKSMGLDVSAPITSLATKLREVIVPEWLGSNKHEYEYFICDTASYESEALKFLL